MEIYVDNKIYVKDYDNYISAYCKNNLQFVNPEFIKKQQQGRWLGNTQPNIVLYEKIGNNVILPFGCLADLFRDLTGKVKFYNKIINSGVKIDYKSNIKPYAYQEKAIQTAIHYKNGVIVMPCGSGKTQTALEMIARIGGRTLWLTHTNDLLTQSMNRAKSCFGLSVGEFGVITAGRINVGNAITFATVQTMSNIDLSSLKNYFDVVIVDECHKCIGSPTNMMMFYKVLSNLSARYKYGLTATPKRADGMERCMYAILGKKIYEVDKKEVACNTCPVVVKKVKTDFTPDIDVILAGDGTLVYASLVKNITQDSARNKKIVEDLQKLNGSTLILSDRVEHLTTLHQMLNRQDSAVMYAVSASKSSRELRKRLLDELNTGKIKYLFATYKLAKEGLDVPSLKYLVMATPQKDETTVVQSAGRVGRKAENKDHGTVIDYVDNFGILMGYSKKRDRYYKKLGYSIDIL